MGVGMLDIGLQRLGGRQQMLSTIGLRFYILFDGESLVFQLHGTLLAVVKVLSLDIYVIISIDLIMVLAFPAERSCRFPIFSLIVAVTVITSYGI